MKKIVLVMAATVVAAFVLSSCGGKKADATEVAEAPIQSAEVVTAPVVDTHTAKNSLDFAGTYKGILPTANKAGMDVTIVLTDSTFTKTFVYVGKKESFEKAGKYAWDTTGFIITLEGVDAPNQYRVVEGALIALDMDGKEIEGELAANYRLAKAE